MSPSAAAPPESAPQLVRGSVLFVVTHAAALLVSLGGSALLVRVADQQDVASYLMFLHAATVLGLALQLGLGTTVQRFVPLMRGDAAGAAALRRRVAIVQLATWAVVLPAVVAVWPRLSGRLGAPELGSVALAIAACGALLSLSRLLGGYLRAVRRYTAALFDQLGPRALVFAGLALLMSRGEVVSWPALVAVYATALGATAVFQVAALREVAGEADSSRPAAALPGVAGLARMSLIAGAHVVAATLLVSVDLWALSATRSDREVAVYGMMLSLLQVVSLGASAAQFVVPQELSRLHAEGRRDELEDLVRTTATATLLFAALAAAGLVLLGRPLIAGVLGDEYLAGWGYLMVLLVGRLWDAASGPAGSLLLMTGHHVRVTVTTCAATAGTVLLALLLVPRLGGYGVAAAASAGLAAVNLANVSAARRLLGVRTSAHLALAPYRRVISRLAPGAGRAG